LRAAVEGWLRQSSARLSPLWVKRAALRLPDD
jgi:hypothetical protein